MKIAAGLIAGQSWKCNINKLLTSLSKAVDEIYIIDNSFGEVTDEIKKYEKVYFHLIQKRGTRFGGLDYTSLYGMAKSRNVDWMFIMDLDEVLDPECIRERLEKEIELAEEQGCDSISFEIYEMWNDEQHYICHRMVNRIYKVKPGLTYIMTPHSSAMPNEIQPGRHSGMWIKHLGHMTQEIRDYKRKYYFKNFITNEMEYLDAREKEALWFNEEEAEKKIKKWNQRFQ